MNKKIKTKQGVGLKGVYKITKAFIETPEQWKLHDKIKRLKEEGKEYISFVRKLNKMCRTEVLVIDNIIPTVGRTMIADNLTNPSPDNTLRINYTALGTGDTAVANGDTTLATEVYRKATASETNASNVAYVTAFFDATEVDGTFKEAGLVSDGSAGADTGILFSRVLLNPTSGIVKSNTETLTIDWTITIN